jgi:hypothetical protein
MTRHAGTYGRHGEVDVEGFEYGLDVGPEVVTPDTATATSDTPMADQRPQDLYVMLTVRRGKRATPFRLGYDPRLGDIAAVAVHRPARQKAVDHLARLGWRPIGAVSRPTI